MNEQDSELVSALRRFTGARNGIPTDAAAAARVRGCKQARVVLEPWLEGELVLSPLGAGLTERVSARLSSIPDPDRLRRSGWLPLDSLRTKLGALPDDSWAVSDGDFLVVAVRLSASGPTGPVEEVLERCRLRREVRLLDVLELRELARRGAAFPVSDRVLTVAADVEATLGGRDLVTWASGTHVLPPIPLGRACRSKRIDVAVSGVDGAGKSTLRALVEQQLRQIGIPVSVIWARPGMALGQVRRAGLWMKRRLRQDAEPGIRAVAGQRSSGLRSRRGVVGLAWSLVVVTSFLLNARRQSRRTSGVVLWDRHLLDALATLEFAYEGVDLRLATWLVRRFLPNAAVTFYLDIPADLAAERKLGDSLGEFAVRRQLETYLACKGDVTDLIVLDGTQPPEVNARHVLRHLTAERP